MRFSFLSYHTKISTNTCNLGLVLLSDVCNRGGRKQEHGWVRLRMYESEHFRFFSASFCQDVNTVGMLVINPEGSDVSSRCTLHLYGSPQTECCNAGV